MIVLLCVSTPTISQFQTCRTKLCRPTFVFCAFHEKAGMSQVCFFLSVFFFLPVDSLHSSLAASVAILPSALFVERFSLGAWWAFPISVGAAT